MILSEVRTELALTGLLGLFWFSASITLIYGTIIS